MTDLHPGSVIRARYLDREVECQVIRRVAPDTFLVTTTQVFTVNGYMTNQFRAQWVPTFTITGCDPLAPVAV